MNTSKQINVMIGLLFVAFLGFSAYIVTEPARQASAREAQLETSVRRGADLYVANCRTCHGVEGLGGAEGALAPALNNPAFLIFGEDNQFGIAETAEGEAQAIRDFVFNTTACGRVNSAMPLWLERYGGSLSETQINYLVATITTLGGWDVVVERGKKKDAEEGTHPDEILIPLADAGTLAMTVGNCGQYQGAVASEFRNRDPFTDLSAAPGPGEEPVIPDDPNAATEVQGVLVGTFFANNCAVCHGPTRGGGVGPALTPDVMTQADDVYFDIIANGVPGTAMPSWRSAGLDDDEITNLVNYIKHVAP